MWIRRVFRVAVIVQRSKRQSSGWNTLTLPSALVAVLLPALHPDDVIAQLRVVTYNTATGNTSPGFFGRQADFTRVLDFIGRESVNGIAKPIDVLILQEQSDLNNSLASFAAELNAITGTSNYVAWTQNPTGTDGLDTGFVYNSGAVTPILQDWFGTGSSRATSRVALQPVGYAGTHLYIYNTHHTAGSTAGDLVERRDEAFDIRINASSGSTNGGPSGVQFGSDYLPANASIIYSGDFNQQSSFEEAASDPFPWTSNPYEILKLGTQLGTSGNGQAVDPINAPGTWNNNSGFASIHTQSPHDGSFGLVTGGMDDRFDLLMVSTELGDGEGLSYIGPGTGDSPATGESYRTFGNNGTNYNQPANVSGNTGLNWIISAGHTLPGMTPTQTRDAVRNSLARASDHSPVVLDLQLPASMNAVADTIPTTLMLGESFNLNITVSNAANVVASLGADELDYSLMGSGPVIGSGSGVDPALGPGNVHAFVLDTTTPGTKSGMITITSSSQSVANGLIEIPVAYEVITPLPGDFDMSGDVNAVDIDLLAANQGSVPPNDAKFDLDSDGDADFVISPSPIVDSDSDLLIRAILNTEYGDANLDGKVNFLDASAFAGGFGSGGGWEQGNFNGVDGIDFLDASVLSGTFGFDNMALGAGAISGVPEPTALELCLMLAAANIRRRSRWFSSNRVLGRKSH